MFSHFLRIKRVTEGPDVTRFAQVTHVYRLVVMVGAIMAVLAGCGGSDGDEGSAAITTTQAGGGNDWSLRADDIFTSRRSVMRQKWTDTLRLRSHSRRDRSDHCSVRDQSESRCRRVTAIGEGRHPERQRRSQEPGSLTLVLLQLDAVIGLKGRVDTENNVLKLKSVGTTCALCHSTVDNSFLPGIGKRLDGWPNRDLNVGAIIALSPAVAAERTA